MNRRTNRDLDDLLKKISQKVESASSQDDLIAAIGIATEYGSPLEFDNTLPYGIGVAGIVLAVSTGVFAFALGLLPVNWYSMGAMAGFVLVAASGFVFGRSRSDALAVLSADIFKKDLLLDNGLHADNDKQVFKRLSTAFKEFDRGNHSREFKNVFVGKFEGDEYDFEYRYFHYHYVNSRIVIETHPDGKGGTRTQTRTVYDHYDRYGLVARFGSVTDLSITGAGGIDIAGRKYRPASNKFNRLFNVTAASDLTASKFLKPAVVIECEEFSSLFKGLNYEFSSDGELCLSFADDDVLGAKRVHGIETPRAFLAEIAGHTKLPKLKSALDHIHALMKYSNTNLREKKA